MGDDENWAQPKLRDSSKWLKQYDDNYPNKDLMASAKTIAVKNQILIWQREAPDDKIIGKQPNTVDGLTVLLTNIAFQSLSTGPSSHASLAGCFSRKGFRSCTTLATWAKR